MTSYYPFTPSQIQAPRFNLLMDYQDFTVVVTWNLAAQRYYVNLYGLDGTWIFTVPLTETAKGRAVQSMTYNTPQGVLIGQLEAPIWREPGQIVMYTLEGFVPTMINGKKECLRLPDGQFQFASADPGVITTMGYASRYEDMAAGYFKWSTLIYRNNQFETNP